MSSSVDNYVWQTTMYLRDENQADLGELANGSSDVFTRFMANHTHKYRFLASGTYPNRWLPFIHQAAADYHCVPSAADDLSTRGSTPDELASSQVDG